VLLDKPYEELLCAIFKHEGVDRVLGPRHLADLGYLDDGLQSRLQAVAYDA
jgi:hypothetical protein